MKQREKTQWGLWVLALAAAVVAAVMLLPRAAAERENRTFDLVADYKDYQQMSEQSEHSIEWWLTLLKEQGVRNVALFESTVESLNRDMSIPVSYWTAKDMWKNTQWRSALPEAVAERVAESTSRLDFVVSCEDEKDMDWILSALLRRAEDVDYVRGGQNGTEYLFVASNDQRELQKLPLGFWPETVEMLNRVGLSIIPRTTSVENLNGMRFMEDVLASFDAVNAHPAYFMPAGDGLLGYDDAEPAHDELVAYLQRSGAVLTATEQNDQSGNMTWDGFDALCAEQNYRVVRMFNEWPYVQNRYAYYHYSGSEEITNCLYRALVERNCRVVYLRAILETDTEESDEYITDPAAYEQLLTDLLARLDRQGMSPGAVSPMRNVTQPFWLLLLMGVCAIAAAVLALCVVVPLKPVFQWGLWGIGSLGVLGAMIAAPNMAKLLLSIGGGIAYPSLAMLCLLRRLQNRAAAPGALRVWAESVGGMLLCVFGALCGALVTTASLSETAYMLEFRLYRAVKLMQIVPIGLYVLGYLIILLPEQLGIAAALEKQIGAGSGAIGRLRRWLNKELERPVKLRWALWTALVAALVAVAGVVGLYYISRTGNNATSVSTVELMFRNVLEERLVARPRTKEFLIGVPCLMLFIYFLRRGWRLPPFFVGLGMAIGMTSFVNTFLHLRAPLYLSFARTGYAVAFGLILGAAVIAFFEIVRALRGRGRGKRV